MIILWPQGRVPVISTGSEGSFIVVVILFTTTRADSFLSRWMGNTFCVEIPVVRESEVRMVF